MVSVSATPGGKLLKFELLARPGPSEDFLFTPTMLLRVVDTPEPDDRRDEESGRSSNS